MTQDTPGYRVLLVDDIGHGLAAVATRLEEALTLAWREAFDLVILDLNLGGALTYRVWVGSISKQSLANSDSCRSPLDSPFTELVRAKEATSSEDGDSATLPGSMKELLRIT